MSSESSGGGGGVCSLQRATKADSLPCALLLTGVAVVLEEKLIVAKLALDRVDCSRVPGLQTILSTSADLLNPQDNLEPLPNSRQELICWCVQQARNCRTGSHERSSLVPTSRHKVTLPIIPSLCRLL